MKKIYFLIFSLLFLCSVKAQQEKFSLTAIQAGTINITSGKTVINLSDEVQEVLRDPSLSASYYVVFTPINSSTVFSIANKTLSSFTTVIQSKNDSIANSSVDYVVFVKRRMIQLNATKSLARPTLHN